MTVMHALRKISSSVTMYNVHGILLIKMSPFFNFDVILTRATLTHKYDAIHTSIEFKIKFPFFRFLQDDIRCEDTIYHMFSPHFAPLYPGSNFSLSSLIRITL